MSKAHYIQPDVTTHEVTPVRLGAGTGSSNNLSIADEGKFIKLVGESRYDLAVAGDTIEGVIYAVEPATSGGYSIGGRIQDGMLNVTFDGAQATAGAGTHAVGDYVLVGTAVAKGTAQTIYPRVVKATDQAAAKASPFAWRVVSLGTAGTGAVSTAGVIERVR